MILTKNICFQNIRIKLNSGGWMSDFPGLRTFADSMTSKDSTTSVEATDLDSLISSKKLLILMVGSSLAPK
jgi:hypothetical protein